jgi:serine/threonine protein kinase
MELDILHRAIAPQIVEFYGAFFIESCVYYCMEFMDAGSLDKVYAGGVEDEKVLATITKDIVTGLGFLKDTLQIMHRGPSLCSARSNIVTPELNPRRIPQTSSRPTSSSTARARSSSATLASQASSKSRSRRRTSVARLTWRSVFVPSSFLWETYRNSTESTLMQQLCSDIPPKQPERITGEYANQLGTYSVSSDVWSLGLSIIEIAIGKYPYPPETFSSPLAQLQAIVHGQPPTLPESFSAEARDFVASWCVALIVQSLLRLITPPTGSSCTDRLTSPSASQSAQGADGQTDLRRLAQAPLAQGQRGCRGRHARLGQCPAREAQGQRWLTPAACRPAGDGAVMHKTRRALLPLHQARLSNAPEARSAGSSDPRRACPRGEVRARKRIPLPPTCWLTRPIGNDGDPGGCSSSPRIPFSRFARPLGDHDRSLHVFLIPLYRSLPRPFLSIARRLLLSRSLWSLRFPLSV